MKACEAYDVNERRKKRKLHTFVYIFWTLINVLLSELRKS